MQDAAGQRLPPAVMVVSAEEVSAVLAMAGAAGALLLSAEGAGGFLGARAWLAMVGTAPAALCCGAAAGDALVAIRAGCGIVVLDGAVPAFAVVAGAAAEAGALLLPRRPPALEARRLDLRREAGRARLAAWLAAPDDTVRTLR